MRRAKSQGEFDKMKGKQEMREVLQRGLEEKVFPGVVALVAQGGKIVFSEHTGYRSLMPERVSMARDTVFDLASLTKVLATTPAIMKLIDEEKLTLDQPLAEVLPKAAFGDKGDLTLRLLLTHSAGLVDWKPFYEKLINYPMKDRKRLLREWIIEEPFAYEPGKGNLYSDLGFMLLEWVIEEKSGQTVPEYVQEYFYGPLGLKRTFFPPPLCPLPPGEGRMREKGGVERGEGRGDPWIPAPVRLGGFAGMTNPFSRALEEIMPKRNLRRLRIVRGERGCCKAKCTMIMRGPLAGTQGTQGYSAPLKRSM
jgi:CubicO group peptidase (beta-lactamase class C family)